MDDKAACEDACAPAWDCCNPYANGNSACFEEQASGCFSYSKCHSLDGFIDAAHNDLDQICSKDSIEVNRAECELACSSVQCCYTPEESCVTTHFQACMDYAPCQNLKNSSIAVAPNDLDGRCNQQAPTCKRDCREALCCSDTNSDCYRDNFVACLSYTSCTGNSNTSIKVAPLYSRTDPAPIILDDICSPTGLTNFGPQKCLEACAPVQCCWDRGAGGCFGDDPLGCMEYQMCTILQMPPYDTLAFPPTNHIPITPAPTVATPTPNTITEAPAPSVAPAGTNETETAEPEPANDTLTFPPTNHIPITPAPAVASPTTAQQTCDYTQDTCCYQFDGACDAPEYCSGTNADCFDCDTCREFSYDCSSCLANGCYYCPGDALCASTPLGNSVWSLHPHRQPSCREETDWQQQCSTNTTGNFWTDPLYDAMQWSYQLINVKPVWEQGLTGQGIHVRVNDDGVDAEHPEFVDNFDEEHSCTSYLPIDYSTDTHGTGCASLIAGAKNNGHCAAGIAPDVTLSACNGPATLADVTEMFLTHLDQVDVFSNSWGPLPCKNTLPAERRLQQQQCPFDPNHPESPCNQCGGTESFAGALSQSCEKAITDYCSSTYENDPVACGEYLDLYVSCRFHALSQSNEEGFAKVIAEGRGGLGPIITFAGGNDYKIGVDANGDGMVNSRYTIAVGAVGKDGLHASYSTTGAAILVAAPGGDEEALSNNIVANPGGGCHDITVGTSFATPVVSAVAALILQANPDLSWREVQGILALTSQRVDFEDSSWYTNKAGISHSYKYGFGLIDAAAAVALAQSWENWGSEKQIMVESGVVDVAIPDNVESPNGEFAVLTMTEEDVLAAAGDKSIAMESVVIYLDLKHGSRGDLQIVLTSPQGTKSILAPSQRPQNKILGEDQRWKLMTLRNWGESPIGTWALEIADEKEGHISDCVNMDWEYVLDGTRYNCGDLEESGVTNCKSPSQVPVALMQGAFNGLKIEDACCVCGGGHDAAGIDQRLQSWRMVAYGHIIPET